jgi:inorganic phosphate transporter, PiT family
LDANATYVGRFICALVLHKSRKLNVSARYFSGFHVDVVYTPFSVVLPFLTHRLVMDSALVLCVIIVLVALAFDFTNGFHDAANSIATIVATGVLKPAQAVMWAAIFHVLALLVFDVGVAKTVGNGMIDLSVVTPMVILAGLLGAIVWNLLTWWWGLPSSSSHALIGGYAGAAVTNHALALGNLDQGFDVMITAGWMKTLLFMLLAPVIGGALAWGLQRLTAWGGLRFGWAHNGALYGRLQLASSAFLSLTHGGNDAQKTAGIIAGALLTSGVISEFHIPFWVLTLSYVTIALGTLAGGWRIVHTMGHRLTHLDRRGGFSAESGAALTIMTATLLQLPISTTHATTGAIMGTGWGQHEAQHWQMARRILVTWLLTIPASGLVGGLLIWLLR